MKVIACCPGIEDSFWVACSKEEAEKWFVPLLDERGKEHYQYALDLVKKNTSLPDNDYAEMIKSAMCVDELAYAYFCVSRDLSKCYSDVPHHPFHQLWNGYSPFRLCDQVDINTPEELKDLVMTWKGRPLSDNDTTLEDS